MWGIWACAFKLYCEELSFGTWIAAHYMLAKPIWYGTTSANYSHRSQLWVRLSQDMQFEFFSHLKTTRWYSELSDMGSCLVEEGDWRRQKVGFVLNADWLAFSRVHNTLALLKERSGNWALIGRITFHPGKNLTSFEPLRCKPASVHLGCGVWNRVEVNPLDF